MRTFSTCFIFAFGVLSVNAAATTPQETEFFEKQVRPVLVERCYKCHGAEKQKGELRLDSRAALLKGSDNGPVVVPGKPDESSLIKSIRHQGDSKMPEKSDKLPDEQIAALAEWVKMGFPWPEGEKRSLSAIEIAAKSHWSFQPVRKPEVPAVAADPQAPIQNPIDAFIGARLAAAKMKPAAAASPAALIRRATYDLTGLPPTAEEIVAFESDSAPGAFARVVDRLLASPRYGERWGRHWLDVARYADTKGYVFQEERRYPFSYTYRDWVIGAFNSDMPYDQFLMRQIAADRMDEGTDSQAALGFLTLGRRFINNINDIIDDRIDVICRGTMGLTTVCARCHDHKFDPISQKDYYALYGVFASSAEPEARDLPLLSTQSASNADYLRERADRENEIQNYLAKRGVELGIVISQLQGAPVILPAESIDPVFKTRFFTRKAKDEMRELNNKLLNVEIGPNAPARAMALVDKPQPVTPRVFIRGNPGRPGDEVPRRFLTVLSGGDPKPFSNGSGRLELARAIASKENPLTARVFVNRVWAHHFGAGLVRTPSDFGAKGELPTHPELLDWLASTFMEEGWSIKKLQRLILLSHTYQQASDADPAAALTDPENRLVSHMHRQRLDFEAMRDSLLFVSGQLDPAMGGRPVEIIGNQPAKRRTVYGFIDRQNLPGIFRTFDFASPDATTPQRHVTTVPQQALFMMNSPFVLAQAKALVAKPEFAKQEASEWQIQDLYKRVLARNAEPPEVEAGLRYLDAQMNQPAVGEETPLWKYGYGGFDAAAGKVEFHPLPAWTGNSWQGAKQLPDKTLAYLSLHANGGHPGIDAQHAAIRRWTAPRDGIVSISGALSRPSKEGDGIIGRVVSSRAGEVLNVNVEPGATAGTAAASIEVRTGDTLDFIVEPGNGDSSDSFTWSMIIHGNQAQWVGSEGFSGPPAPRSTPLTAWEKYAQAILQTNEFVFID